MQRCYTGEQLRAAERPRLHAGDGPALMRTAAWGLAQHTQYLLADRGRVYGAGVVGLIGKGHNGGDTLWALSFLARRGVAIAAVAINTTADQLHPAGLAAFTRAGGRLITHLPGTTAAVIDGVFGTGFSGVFDLPGYLADHGLQIPASAAIIACDIASGVLADTGQLPGDALVADLTVTFGGLKLGLVAESGAQHAGEIVVVDIGITEELAAIEDPWWMAEASDVARVFAAPAWDAQKYSRGVLSVVAGSSQYPGAAVLVVNAAVTTGVGYLSVVTDRGHDATVAEMVLAAQPQAVVVNHVPPKTTAIVVGPGLSASQACVRAAEQALDAAATLQCPVLVDASGLDMLSAASFARHLPALILTPHVGEMQRLTQRLNPSASEHRPVEQAVCFARRFGAWVVLKSATTYVVSPTGVRSVHPPGTSALATAGTGDTLAGILGAGLSTLDPHDPDFADDVFAVLTAGVRLHSMAGAQAAAHGGVVVSTLADAIRDAKQQAGEY